MPNLKNIFVGFTVSFIGSIPLGYLNVIGFTIFQSSGILSTLYYLLGVIVIEFFVIFGTLLFAEKLHKNLKLLQYIEAFSILFMFFSIYFSHNRKQRRNKYFLPILIFYKGFFSSLNLSNSVLVS
jgi:hypothetical protein